MKDLMARISRKLFGDSYFKEVRHIGNEGEPVYYIIRRVPFGEGFFSNYFYVLSHVVYACRKGWRPVVDMENYKTLYHDTDAVGNLWERYFEPMDGSTLEQAYRSKNYVLSSGKYLSESGVPVYEINRGHITDEMVRHLSAYADRFAKVKSDIAEEAEAFQTEHQWNRRKYVGVHVRGTDMHVKREGHTLPPELEEIIRRVDTLLETEKADHIFLCTDEEKVTDFFGERYGDRLVYCEEYRSSSDSDTGLHKETGVPVRAQHKYLLGKEILKDAILLSRCSRLICGISNVTSAAILFNNLKYEEVQVVGK